MNEELKEWLGLTYADSIFSLAFVLTIVGCLIKNIMIFTIVFILSISLGIYSAKLGMPRKKEVSNFTNIVKKWSYPFCLFILFLIILGKYSFYFFT